MTDDAATGLIDYLRASPSPFHACVASAAMLRDAGFMIVAEPGGFPTEPGRYYLVRGGSLIAWSTEHARGPTTPFRVVGAHTDSPNLRIKPQPDLARAGFHQLGVEVYGGPLLNSWLDRDLGISGRVSVRAGSLPDNVRLSSDPGSEYRRHDDRDAAQAETRSRAVVPALGSAPAGVETVLIHLDEPLLRVAQLAVHLDRKVNSNGLTLNTQQHLSPIWALGDEPADFRAFLAETIGLEPADVLAWDVMTHDVQPPARIGRDGEFIAGGRMDNLATSYAGTKALIEVVAGTGTEPRRGPKPERAHGTSYQATPIPVLALFDHEEVGSASERGAQSVLLPEVLERIVLAQGGLRDDYHRAMAGTVIASGDMAHATHPNYVDRHEPEHQISIDGGPVLKINAQLRYATGAPGAAAFALACEQANVPMQRFVSRTDLPCGSTVGPVTAARTGAETVDFGAAMLSMHSARELVGARDQGRYVAALTAFLAPR